MSIYSYCLDELLEMAGDGVKLAGITPSAMKPISSMWRGGGVNIIKNTGTAAASPAEKMLRAPGNVQIRYKGSLGKGFSKGLGGTSLLDKMKGSLEKTRGKTLPTDLKGMGKIKSMVGSSKGPKMA